MTLSTRFTRRALLGGLAAVGATAALTPLTAWARRDTLDLDLPAMGTRFRLVVAGGRGAWGRVDLPRLKRDIQDVLAGTEADFSPFRGDSALMRFNAATTPDWQTVPPHFARVLERAMALRARTDGAFDPAVGRLVEAWGFWGAPRRLTSDARPEVALGDFALDGARARKSTPELAADLCAIAKGDALDRVCARVRDAGLDNVMAELGGEIKAFGPGPDGRGWRIGVENPTGGHLARVRLDGRAIATSGDYVKFFTAGTDRLGHIVDPRTGRPTGGALALVSVIADDAATADAWATALYARGAEHGPALARTRGVAALFARRGTHGLDVTATPGFPGGT